MKDLEVLTCLSPGWFLVPNKKRTDRHLTFLSERTSTAYFLAERQRLWYANAKGFVLLDTGSGRVIATVPFALNLKEQDPFPLIQVCSHRKFLFITVRSDEQNCRMTVLSLKTGQVWREINGLPDLLHIFVRNVAPIVVPVTESGGHLFSGVEGERGSFRSVLVTLDPQTGTWTIENLVAEDEQEPVYMVGLVAPSPDGRYWLRTDGGPLVKKKPTQRRWFRNIAQGPSRYAIEVQVWQTEPLRFFRKLTVDWLDVTALGDPLKRSQLNLGRRDDPREKQAIEAMLDIIEARSEAYEGTTALGLPTSDLKGTLEIAGLPPKEEPGWAHVNPMTWDMTIGLFHSELRKQALNQISNHGRPVWTHDGDAIWFKTGPHLICIGLDGQASRRFEKPKLAGDAWIIPSDGRAAFAVAAKERVPIDGRPVQDTFALPPIAPLVEARPDLPSDEERSVLYAEIKARVSAASELRIDLAASQTPQAALNAIADAFRNGAMQMAVDEFDIKFKRGEKRVISKTFWTSVIEAGPAVLPALRNVIETFLDLAPSDRFYSSAGDGESSLAQAATCLAMLDLSSVDTLVRRYAEHFDGSNHQSLFAKILPAALKAHDWTPETIRLGLWAVFVDRGITPEDPQYFWRDGGLKSVLEIDYTHEEVLAMAEELTPKQQWPRVLKELESSLSA